MVEDQNH